MKSRRERDAIFACSFLKFLSLTGKLEPSLRAPNKTVSSLLKQLYFIGTRNAVKVSLDFDYVWGKIPPGKH